MSAKHTFKSWNIASNLLSGYTFGHMLWETKLLVETLARRGTEVRVLGHTSVRAEYFPGARIVPAFKLHYRAGISKDPEWQEIENFVVHNLAFEKALGNLDPSIFQNALTLFPEISERQLLGTLRWLERLDQTTRPQIALILHGQLDWSPDEALEIYRKIWAGRPDTVKRNTKLCVRSETIAQRYEQLLGVRPHILPSALGPTEREVKASRDRVGSRGGSFVVSFLAGARLERGAALVPDVVKECEHLGVRFLIQVTDPVNMAHDQVASLKSLEGRPGVHLHDGVLSREDYNDWITQSVVLLAYEADRYKSRTSGVYLEAKCFGAPVIVPAGGWMAEEVSRLGNGLVFEEYSAASIARCIARAQTEIAALRDRAAVCAERYRRQHGADRCVDAVESLFE